ncbi:unnamed protein product [Rotaria sordida]|uniref:Uncharacterized protein n=1 Tax=Rotaria sordida TaxID=392033 RepID=A0A814JY95_9BILA|nr:unnamed protein product [Rotaria sordida]
MISFYQKLGKYPALFTALDGNAITTKFNDHKKFKEAYYLHDFRIAVTLWSKKSGEKVFHRHDDKQCISQISTQDKNTKIRQKKKTYCSHL